MVLMIDVIFVGIMVFLAFIGLIIMLRIWWKERKYFIEKQDLLKEDAKKVEHSSLLG
ncbi:MAG: hypothetical protein ABH864_05655 [archaeon]